MTFIRTANTEEQRESTCSSNVGVRRLRRSVTATNSRRDGRRVCAARIERTHGKVEPFLGTCLNFSGTHMDADKNYTTHTMVGTTQGWLRHGRGSRAWRARCGVRSRRSPHLTSKQVG